MTGRRYRALKTPTLACLGLAGVLAGLPTSVSAQALDLGRALQDALERSSTRNESRPLSPAPIEASGAPSAREPDFILLGVVVAGEARLALLHDAASSGGPRLLRVGAFLTGYRIADVQGDRVVLEGRNGKRLTVRLGTSGSALPAARAPAPLGSPGLAADDPDSRRLSESAPMDAARAAIARAKEERQKELAEQTAQDKARALAERAR